MENEETPDDGVGLGEIQITIVVVQGRVRAMLTKLLARARVRAGLVSGGLIVALAAGAIVAVSSSHGRAGRPLRADALGKQFGLRLNCSRGTVVSPDGAFARIDLDRVGPCGTFGNQVTLVLHRLHGVWVREFEASRWTCPVRQLPRPVAIALQLCRSNRGANSTDGVLPKIDPQH